MALLETNVTVKDCPLTGFEESVEDKCGMCKHFVSVTYDLEVICNYEETEE